ncbi:hypothetical protein BKA70DRAFT_1437853 [Coprinopsis sp. MPI-PUGE-AT-0042]|nr:hypothetical protein BKA70DRAFT_1437853 [Coprinopsis sp. MPI-PUGE-AT-0042]
MISSSTFASGRRRLAATLRSTAGRPKRLFSINLSLSHAARSQAGSRSSQYYGRLATTSALRPSYSTASGQQGNENKTFQDTHRPEVFYHLVDPPTPVSAAGHAYAISFLDTLEPSMGDGGLNGMGSHRGNLPTVVGWVPMDADGKPVWSAFKDNPAFRPILHETIYAALRDGVDEVWTNGAKQIGSGWMHLHDQRNPPALGRIGDPDDIMGTVLVEDGKIKAETYQSMPSYRVCTLSDGAKDSIGGHGRELGGFMKLTPGLLERLIQSAWRAEKDEKVQTPV